MCVGKQTSVTSLEISISDLNVYFAIVSQNVKTCRGRSASTYATIKQKRVKQFYKIRFSYVPLTQPTQEAETKNQFNLCACLRHSSAFAIAVHAIRNVLRGSEKARDSICS